LIARDRAVRQQEAFIGDAGARAWQSCLACLDGGAHRH
jgi:hypothetical protein